VTVSTDWKSETMADFPTAGYYNLQYDTVTQQFTILGAFNEAANTYTDSDGVATPGEAIGGLYNETYVGSFEGHLVVSDGSYYLSTTSVDPYFDGFTFAADTTTPFIFCFAAGTAIATPSGGMAVEALKPGDLVLTADGRAVPAIFIGRQTLATIFVPEARSLVRIAAGVLGEGLPRRDLVLTGDHALMLDGVLVNAGALVNGTTITRVPRAQLPARFTVYHVETAAHDIILAEGVPAETYMDAKGRARFDNHAAYVPPPGGDRKIEHPAPRVTAPRQVPARLLARIATSWARPGFAVAGEGDATGGVSRRASPERERPAA